MRSAGEPDSIETSFSAFQMKKCEGNQEMKIRFKILGESIMMA